MNKEEKREYMKEYRLNNKEKIKEYDKKYRENNKEKRKEKNKQYREKHHEKELKRKRLYYRNNLEKIKEDSKQYYNKNSKEMQERMYQWRKNNPGYMYQWRKNNPGYMYQWRKNNPGYMYQWRKNNPGYMYQWRKNNHRTDLKFNLNDRMRRAINHSLKGNKNGRHWETLVGYTLDDLVKRLKKTMPEGYCWEDCINGRLHLDHKIPISVFNFEKPEHIDFKRCWALKNLQLLPARENLIKSNKLEKPFQLSLQI